MELFGRTYFAGDPLAVTWGNQVVLHLASAGDSHGVGMQWSDKAVCLSACTVDKANLSGPLQVT